MCNRVKREKSFREIGPGLPQKPLEEFFESLGGARFNIAPTQSILIIRQLPGAQPEPAVARWGFPARGPNPAPLFNARAETAAEKPTFRSAFAARRCVIPVDGFYEWRKLGKKRLPHLFTLNGDAEMLMAGLWEDSGGEICCTILTVDSNEIVQPLHDRMPLILRPQDCAQWLNPQTDPAALKALLQPYPAARMQCREVNAYVNNSRNEGPKCIAPPEEEPSLFS